MGPAFSWFDTPGFFLWGYVKTSIYKTSVNNIDDLKKRITDQIKSIEQETLNKVFGTIVKRLELCIDVAGDTFEKYLWDFFVE